MTELESVSSDSPTKPAWQRYLLPVLVSVVVAGGCAWLLWKGALPVVPPAAAFDAVKWWVVPVYVAMYLVCLVLRSVRWRWLLSPIQWVPMKRILTVSFIFYGASVVLPFRTGELVRPSLFRSKEHISWWAATGIVGAERVTDGLVLSILLFASLQLAQPLPVLPDHIGQLPVPVSVVPGAAYSALGIFACAFVGMGLFYWRREWMRHATRSILGVVSVDLADLVAGVLERLADGLRFLPTFRYSAPFVGITVAYWIINALSVWLLLLGVGLEQVTLAQGSAVLGVLALGFLTPNAPGFFGTFQLSVYAGMAMYLVPGQVVGPGAAAVFLLYVTQLGTVLLTSSIALVVESLSPASVPPDAAAEVG